MEKLSRLLAVFGLVLNTKHRISNQPKALFSSLAESPALQSQSQKFLIKWKQISKITRGVAWNQLIIPGSIGELEAHNNNLSHVTRVHDRETPPYRPSLSEPVFDESLRPLIQQCWAELANLRPDTGHVVKVVKNLNGGKKLSLVDHVTRMLEQHTNHLEEVVAEQTGELVTEKRKTDSLLKRMLPPSVVEKLKSGLSVPAESFDDVTIYFSDIESFTKISSASTPMQVVTLLNSLYTMFDRCLCNRDVYKVETIGDAYMVVSGLPTRNQNRHAGEIADLSLDLLSGVLQFEIPHMPDVQLRIRIGLHTGPCCAGVVGVSMPRYCLFGETVTVAATMEATGCGLRVHVSSSTHAALVGLGGYRMEPRSDRVVPDYSTFWLLGKEGRKDLGPSYQQLHPIFRRDGLALRFTDVTNARKNVTNVRNDVTDRLTDQRSAQTVSG